jgi:hypothetical protein
MEQPQQQPSLPQRTQATTAEDWFKALLPHANISIASQAKYSPQTQPVTPQTQLPFTPMQNFPPTPQQPQPQPPQYNPQPFQMSTVTETSSWSALPTNVLFSTQWNAPQTQPSNLPWMNATAVFPPQPTPIQAPPGFKESPLPQQLPADTVKPQTKEKKPPQASTPEEAWKTKHVRMSTCFFSFVLDEFHATNRSSPKTRVQLFNSKATSWFC